MGLLQKKQHRAVIDRIGGPTHRYEKRAINYRPMVHIRVILQ
jgi:hypothetical protein